MSPQPQPLDILGEILNGPAEAAPDRKLEELADFCMERQTPPVLGIVRRNARPPLHKKTTHYLEQEIFESLERLRDFLRAQLPPHAAGRRRPLSKSAVVNAALTLLIEEYRACGRRSALIGRLLQKL